MRAETTEGGPREAQRLPKDPEKNALKPLGGVSKRKPRDASASCLDLAAQLAKPVNYGNEEDKDCEALECIITCLRPLEQTQQLKRHF